MKAEDLAAGLRFLRNEGFDDYADAIVAEREALIAERDALREALLVFRNYGCPVCHGDCASANPPVGHCPMQIARATLERNP